MYERIGNHLAILFVWICGLLTVGGCDGTAPVGSADAAVDEDGAPVTWHGQIAPLVMEHCGTCHREGGIAPFALTTYAQARTFAAQLAAAVETGRMPPFLARETDVCAPPLPFRDDLRLTAEERGLFRAWADSGAPEGEALGAVEPSLPEPKALPREDVRMTLPAPIEVDGPNDVHTCVIVDPGLSEDAYVVGRHLTAGNSRVLHHVVSYLVQPGSNPDGSPRSKAELEAVLRERKGVGIGGRYDCFGGPSLSGLDIQILDAWAPGAVPNLAPADSGQPLSKDALVILDMHYHPNGLTETDSTTRLALMLATTEPTWVSNLILLGNFTGYKSYGIGVGELLRQEGEQQPQFVIPAGAREHVEEMTWTWDFAGVGLASAELYVYAMGTHMHYAGRDMRVWLEPAQRSDELCLIQTPDWDYNWQRAYMYDAPRTKLPVMGQGDTIHMRCVFDNSMENRFVREALAQQGLDAPQDVRLGEDTLDEMCLAVFGIMHLNLGSLGR